MSKAPPAHPDTQHFSVNSKAQPALTPSTRVTFRTPGDTMSARNLPVVFVPTGTDAHPPIAGSTATLSIVSALRGTGTSTVQPARLGNDIPTLPWRSVTCHSSRWCPAPARASTCDSTYASAVPLSVGYTCISRWNESRPASSDDRNPVYIVRPSRYVSMHRCGRALEALFLRAER